VDTQSPARLQLVVPCYNEAERLDSDAFVRFVGERRDVGLVFVNDGSTDATSAVLADIAQRSPGRVTVLGLARNVGKAASVHHGILAALHKQPELVGFWDADLATPLAAVDEFLHVLDTHPEIDIVMGARVKLLGRQLDRHGMRHYAGRLFATAASLALGIGVYDTQCGAKVFRVNSPIRQVFASPFRSRWVFDIEILARYLTINGNSRTGVGIYELPLKRWTDVAGSKIRIWHGARAFWDVVRIWQRSGW
jgi:glycosyltransferase involved in cell wall biosynthesis